jgi:hypothetical protein
LIACGGRGAEVRLKTGYGIDTVLPLKTNIDAYHDVMGLTRRKDFGWEPYQLPVARIRGQQDRPQTNIDGLGLAEQCEHRTCLADNAPSF